MEIKNLATHKKKVQAKVIFDDLTKVQKVLENALNELGQYKKYIMVMEVMSTIQTNNTLVNIHLKKYEALMKQEQK